VDSDAAEVHIVTDRWQPEGIAPPPDQSIAGTPLRRPGSVRRTAHINMFWPGGFDTPMHLAGRCRDLVTWPDGRPAVQAMAQMEVEVGDLRTIAAISTAPDHPTIGRLVGASGGRRFRTAIDDALPGDREAGTPLHFLLDDIAGCTLIAGFAWSQHRPGTELGGAEWQERRPAKAFTGRTADGRIICSGLRPGGYSHVSREEGRTVPHFLRVAGDLSSEADKSAWHEIDPAPEVCMRRRRRIDAWLSGPDIVVDAHFRDSMWSREHVELALHEYTLSAVIDVDSHVLRSVEATPKVLPFPECPWAAPHTDELVGTPVEGFRTSVQDTLTELHCCTHLNDMLRGLAEVPILVARLSS
jgi:hypothetical protein